MHGNLVRAFYSNAICVEVDDDRNAMFVDHIITFVIRRTLVVNKKSIAHVLGILDVGECNEEQPFPDITKTIKNQTTYFHKDFASLYLTYIKTIWD